MDVKKLFFSKGCKINVIIWDNNFWNEGNKDNFIIKEKYLF